MGLIQNANLQKFFITQIIKNNVVFSCKIKNYFVCLQFKFCCSSHRTILTTDFKLLNTDL